MTLSERILANRPELLRFLKSRFPLIHQSNVFFRDIHYGVIEYLADRGGTASYTETEEAARRLAGEFEKDGILKRLDSRTWLLNYPEFALPRTEKKPA